MRHAAFADFGPIHGNYVSRWYYADGSYAENFVSIEEAQASGDAATVRMKSDDRAIEAMNTKIIEPGEEQRHAGWAIECRKRIDEERFATNNLWRPDHPLPAWFA